MQPLKNRRFHDANEICRFEAAYGVMIEHIVLESGSPWNPYIVFYREREDSLPKKHELRNDEVHRQE